MTDTDRMLVWLREAMDAAERDAKAVSEARWFSTGVDARSKVQASFITPEDPEHLAAYFEQTAPSVTLRRIAADRAILDEHASDGDPQYPQCVRCADTHPGDCECGWHSLGGDH